MPAAASAAGNPAPDPGALQRIDRALKDFEHTVEQNDARDFTNTKLNDVREAARATEKELAAQQNSSALGRIEPLITGLEKCSPVLEVLCGTKELAWIWAPIKLCLVVGSSCLSAYQKFIKAYGDIADALPRFDKLSEALKNERDFQHLLANFYCDILEFHSRTYKFIRQRAWKQCFNSSWGNFERRFGNILDRLGRNADLIDREANAYNIEAVQQTRKILLESIENWEKKQSDDQFEKVINWLDIKDYLQEDHVDRLDSKCHEGTADWFLQHDKVLNWTKADHKLTLLWVNGMPGCGKSVLCSKLIRHLQEQKQSALAFFICDFRSPGRNTCSNVLRQIASQLIKQYQTLVGLVYDEYVRKQLPPTEQNMKRLLDVLLLGIPSSRLFVDGLDECKVREQTAISKAIRAVVNEANKHTECKAAIFSRDTGGLENTFKNDPKISLKDEAAAIGSSISNFVRYEMQQFRHDNADHNISDGVLTRIEQKLVDKADGMFLWVHLVIATLNKFESVDDLEVAVDRLPQGIDKAYGRILEELRSEDPGRLQRATALLSWIALADRPLKTYEVLDGVVFCKDPYQLKESTKLTPRVLDRCKPLIEIDAFGNVSFVHFTVKEYILDQSSGPFLPHKQALYDVAMGCVSYMMSSLDLVDDKIGYDDRIRSVALGLHGFHRYATMKWIHHIEELCNICRMPADIPETLLAEYIKSLCKRHDQLLRLRRPGNCVYRVRVINETRLTAFRDQQDFLHLAGCIREHKRQFGNVVSEQSRCTDPTLFTEVSTTYDKIVQELMKPESERHINGLSDDEIAKFKATYGTGAYQCRAIACPRHSVGFPSHELRLEHERRAHPEVYYCREESCPFSKAPGFLTYSALEEHTADKHPPENALDDLGPRPKKRSKHRQEEACGLVISDASVDELARMLPSKKRSGVGAPVNMAAGEPVPQENGGPTEQQPSAEQSGQQDPSGLPVEAHDTTLNDPPVDGNNTTASDASWAMDETEALTLSIAIDTLSEGPMTIEDISKAMGVPSYNGFAAFLQQIADERAGRYYLKTGITQELLGMMLSGTGIDEAYQQPGRTDESDTAQAGQSSLQHMDVRQGPELQENAQPETATSYPLFVRGQRVFCVRGRSTNRSADEPSPIEGIVCVIAERSFAQATGIHYLVHEGDHDSYDIYELKEVPQSRLRLIPYSNTRLDDLAMGTAVLARYPGTTKFYKANVARDWSGNDASTPDWVGLAFDGEEDLCRMRVERRFVFVESQIQ